MASLPTAYASQRFGRKTLDFYAAGGEVIGGDPRARADERRLEDLEGARHTVRLMDTGFTLEPGDQAAVLRMQPGPARRSRPVAVINHTRGNWTRTHPGASTLLARVGVGRALNFSLTLGLFALAALVVVWPFVRAFLVEIDPAVFSAAPDFNVFALVAGLLPALADVRLSELLAPLGASLGQALPMLNGLEAAMGYTIAALAGGVFVFWSRSWRLLWAPAYVAGLGVGALMFTGVDGAVTPMLAGLGLATTLFLVGGLINSIRDTVRFERRIAVLADHIRNQSDEDLVPTAAPVESVEEDLTPLAPVAVAASLREPEDFDADPAAPVEAQTDEVTDEVESVEAPEEIGAGVDPEGVEETVEADAVEPQAEVELQPEVEPQAKIELQPESGEDITRAEVQEDHPDEAEAPVEVDSPDAERAAEPQAELEVEGVAETPVEPGEAEVDAQEEPVLTPADVLKPHTAEEAQPPAPEASEPVAEVSADEIEAAPIEPEPSDDATPENSGEVEAPTRFEDEESERLKTDPRYAARAIVLPPPPPMPADASEEEKSAKPTSQTRTLRPTAALPPNVVPIFGTPPTPPKSDTDESD